MTFIPKRLHPLERVQVGAHRWYRAAARRVHRATRFHQPAGRAVFVVGSGRSGTDLLVQCLSQSPRTTLINEYHPRVFRNWRLISLDALADALRWSRTEVVLFKPIVETPRTAEFLDAFPDSRAIFIFRNPRDAIISLWKFFGDRHIETVRGWLDDDFQLFPGLSAATRALICATWEADQRAETACAIYWLAYNTSYFDLGLDRHPRVSLLRYDRLTSDPQNTLRDACRFFGIYYRPAMTWQVHQGTSSRRPDLDIPDEMSAACQSTWERLCAAERGEVQGDRLCAAERDEVQGDHDSAPRALAPAKSRRQLACNDTVSARVIQK